MLRRKLLTNCLEKNPYLIKNSVNLQPRWDINPISNLKWSGIDANQNLTDEIMKLSRTNTIATIVHGDSTINQLSKALSKVKKNPVQRLILFHKDSNDYEFH